MTSATTVAPPRLARSPATEGTRFGWPLILGLFATALAMAGSWIPSLWGDEAASVMSAQRPLGSLFRMLTHVDAVHGSYYLMLHFWIDVFGASPFSVRVPPALAVGFAVAAVVAIVRDFRGTKLAIVAGIVTAVVPRITYTGEETRAYAFSAAYAGWAFWVLLQILREGKTSKRWWVAYVALSVAGVYSFLYFALFLVAHTILLVASKPSLAVAKRWLIGVAVTIMAAAPLAVFGVLERAQVAFLSAQTTTDPKSLLEGLWFFGPWFALLAWALIVVALVGWVRDLRAGKPLLSLELVGIVWLFVPVLLLLASTLVVADFTGRYMTYSAPGAGLLMALGIARLARGNRVGILALVVVVVAVATPLFVQQRTPYAKNNSDWAEISKAIGSHAKAGDAVVFDGQASPSRRPRLAKYTYPAGFRGLLDPTLETPYAKNSTWYDRTYTVPQAARLGRFADVKTVWLVEYVLPGSDPDRWGESDLEALGYTEVQTIATHESRIIELTRP